MLAMESSIVFLYRSKLNAWQFYEIPTIITPLQMNNPSYREVKLVNVKSKISARQVNSEAMHLTTKQFTREASWWVSAYTDVVYLKHTQENSPL